MQSTREQPVRVGVTMRRSDSTSYLEARDAISHDWVRFFEQHNLIPILIPSVTRDPLGLIRSLGLQALLISNGEDVVTDDDSTAVNEARNQLEGTLLAYAFARRMPVIGVCRGLHVVQHFLGGPVCPRLPNAADHVARVHPLAWHHHLLQGHELKEGTTNSFHAQGVLRADLAADLLCLASCGEVVEAVVHKQRPIVALQWHPERENSHLAADHLIFDLWLDRQLAARRATHGV